MLYGKVINGYTLCEPLGEGGMAEVWRAESSLGKSVAVKLLKVEYVSMDNIVSRFENEARVMYRLDHPNIRGVYNYSTIEGRPVIVMEIQLKICQEPLDLSRLPQAWQSLLRPLLEKAPEQRGELCLPYETRRDDSESRHAETRYQENSRNSKQATRITHKEPFRVNTIGQGEVQSSSKAKLKSGLSDTTKVFMSLGALLLGYLLIVQFFFSGTPTFYDDYDYGLNVDTMAVEE